MKQIIKKLFFIFLLLSQFALCQKQVDFNELDSYISKAVTDFKATGLSISIVKDGQVVFKNAYGVKNIETGEAVTTGSLFNIASCSKAFTSFCMGLLVEEGVVKWNDKVIDYLPEFQLENPFITSQMNLFDILSHRSGLETFAGDLLWYETNYSDDEIISRLKYIPIKND
ncbi:MAG: beta-lactamase family protein, partial [Ignavibacteriales bacterium]|nr:beta-lactamase family protein [Ignavibacteriales bacterium]